MSEQQTFRNGRYLLVERLGEGGMATVWRAFDQRLQVWRAIKVLLPEYATKRKLIARFESEAQTMALLEHAHIVRVYDVDREGDQAFIVMEVIDGGSLVDWVEKHGAVPPRMAVDILVEVCQAVGFAHERGVIHRDIKPHNILVDRKGTCKITDFGIARAGDDDQGLTKTGAVMGTWGYMAPEQRTDAKHVDRRADVYALAATLYTLLTNQAPMDLFAADRDSSILEGLPDALLPVLRKATEYRKEARYGSAEELAAALLAVRDALPETPAGTPGLAPDALPHRAPPAKTGAPSTPEQTQPTRRATSSPPSGGARDTILPMDPAAARPPEPPPPSTVFYDAADVEAPRPRQRASGFGAVVGLVGVLGLAAWATSWMMAGSAEEAPPIAPVPVATADPVVLPIPPASPPVSPPASPPGSPPVAATDPKVQPKVDPKVGAKVDPKTTVKAADPPAVVTPPPVVVAPMDPPVAATPPPAPARQCIKSVSVSSTVKLGGSVAFKASLCRDGDVTLKYRASGTTSWYTKRMVLRVGVWSAIVNVDDVFAPGIDWYVVAEEASEGSASSPKRINVTP
jgi:serine/threonine protein kinase